MAEIKIDRLTLNLSALSARDGERLARLVAEGLGAADLSTEKSQRLDEVKVRVWADEKGNVDELSEQIVAAVLRQLERTL
ncbi:MAG: hypothetical protein QOE33_3472 [Acidobacteriota bacterium]|nr:hypothetical protein [Acidobacteriota bacterium]